MDALARMHNRSFAKARSNSRYRGGGMNVKVNRRAVAGTIRSLRSRGFKRTKSDGFMGGTRMTKFRKSTARGRVSAFVSGTGVIVQTKGRGLRRGSRDVWKAHGSLKPRSAKQRAASRANGAKGAGKLRKGRR